MIARPGHDGDVPLRVAIACPPGASWSTQADGTLGTAYETKIRSYGPSAGQPSVPSPLTVIGR